MIEPCAINVINPSNIAIAWGGKKFKLSRLSARDDWQLSLEPLTRVAGLTGWIAGDAITWQEALQRALFRIENALITT